MSSLKESLQKTGESIFALFKVAVLSKHQTKIKCLERERDIVVLGNGPSLGAMVKEKAGFLSDKDLLCVNFFPTTELYEQLKPSYYITSAPELWMNNVDEIYITKREELFKALGEKTQWPLMLLIPFSARKNKFWRSYLVNNKNITIIYYNDIGIEGFTAISFWLFRRNLAMPRPHNVIIPSVFTVVNMGYTKIYLWGTENNQFLQMSVDDNNNALISQKHYYDTSDVKAKIMRKGGSGQRKVYEILYKFMLTFKGYHILNQYAQYRKSSIVNQTPESMIDAFEREDIVNII